MNLKQIEKREKEEEKKHSALGFQSLESFETNNTMALRKTIPQSLFLSARFKLLTLSLYFYNSYFLLTFVFQLTYLFLSFFPAYCFSRITERKMMMMAGSDLVEQLQTDALKLVCYLHPRILFIGESQLLLLIEPQFDPQELLLIQHRGKWVCIELGQNKKFVCLPFPDQPKNHENLGSGVFFCFFFVFVFLIF